MARWFLGGVKPLKSPLSVVEKRTKPADKLPEHLKPTPLPTKVQPLNGKLMGDNGGEKDQAEFPDGDEYSFEDHDSDDSKKKLLDTNGGHKVKQPVVEMSFDKKETVVEEKKKIAINNKKFYWVSDKNDIKKDAADGLVVVNTAELKHFNRKKDKQKMKLAANLKEKTAEKVVKKTTKPMFPEDKAKKHRNKTLSQALYNYKLSDILPVNRNLPNTKPYK